MFSQAPDINIQGQPPCEAVSWNAEGDAIHEKWQSQPPCEAVSWNAGNIPKTFCYDVSLLVRLWVEIKRFFFLKHTNTVSLLVRLWVEIFLCCTLTTVVLSASLWGCELKCLAFLQLVIVLAVSLLVRLWVEILVDIIIHQFKESASLWGCELKYDEQIKAHMISLSASLWGCELKYVLPWFLFW